MARGINKVILIAHMGRDPEIKYLPSGGAVANVALATSYQVKNKQTGEMTDRTEWHRVVFFNRLAEIIGEYTRKGSQLYVEGRLQTRKWQDNDGNDRYTTEVIAQDMQMLGGRGAGQGSQQFGQQQGSQQSGHPGSARISDDQALPPEYEPAGPADDFDDDIPF